MLVHTQDLHQDKPTHRTGRLFLSLFSAPQLVASYWAYRIPKIWEESVLRNDTTGTQSKNFLFYCHSVPGVKPGLTLLTGLLYISHSTNWVKMLNDQNSSEVTIILILITSLLNNALILQGAARRNLIIIIIGA